MTNDFIKELLNIIDDTLNLLRQELTTLRNDSMQHKLILEKLSIQVEELTFEKKEKQKRLSSLNIAITTLLTSVIIWLAKHFGIDLNLPNINK